MDLMPLRIFQRQVADQARGALTAVQWVNLGASSGDQDQLWFGIQIFISGAANVGKALWGSGGRKTNERSDLRMSLAVQDESPLRTFTLRNHFEHFDDRIDTWWATSRSRNHLDRMIGRPDTVSGLADQDRFRVFDPQHGIVYFWGQSFPLQPIADELSRIAPIAAAEADKPHWVA